MGFIESIDDATLFVIKSSGSAGSAEPVFEDDVELELVLIDEYQSLRQFNYHHPYALHTFRL